MPHDMTSGLLTDFVEHVRAAAAEAAISMPHHDHYAVGIDNVISRLPAPAARGVMIDLRAKLPRPSRPDGGVEAVFPAADVPAGEVYTIRAALAANSCVAQAGAHIIEQQPPQPPKDEIRGVPVMFRRPSGLRVIAPAKFDLIADPELAAVSETAVGSVVSSATVENDDGFNLYGFRVVLSRRDQEEQNQNELLGQVVHSICAGMGRAADAELLSSLAAADPEDFSLAAAGSASLRFAELRGIIGRPTTQVVADQGNLFAAGIPAELSAETDAAYIAAWSRFGVVVSQRADLLIKRMDAMGSLEVTAWVGMKAVIPDARYAWVLP